MNNYFLLMILITIRTKTSVGHENIYSLVGYPSKGSSAPLALHNNDVVWRYIVIDVTVSTGSKRAL